MKMPWTMAALGLALALGVPQAARACTNCQSVAVVDIDSEHDCNYYSNYWGSFVLIECRNKFHALREMIETAIRKTNKFSVYERNRLYTVMDERSLSRLGVVGGAAYRQRLKGVDFLVYGKITEFSRGSNAIAEGRYAMRTDDAALALDLKIVNVRTGEVVFASNVREEMQTGGSYGSSTVRQADTMSASRVYGLLQRAVAEAISQELAFQGYPPSVARVEGERIYINYGQPFLKRGMSVEVMSLGAPIDDPSTGAQLGRTETPIGTYRVEQVTPAFAVAVPLDPGGRGRGPVRGDVVRFERGAREEQAPLTEGADLP